MQPKEIAKNVSNIHTCGFCDKTFALDEHLKSHLSEEHLKKDTNHKALKCVITIKTHEKGK